MDLIIGILGGMSVIGVVIFGLSRWLGAIWSNRILAKEKVKYDEQIELLKHNLSIAQENITRFNNKQFDSYMSLWSSLQDLKFAGEELWEEANKEKLVKFSTALWDTDKLLEKSRLFLESKHYTELKGILRIFKDYEFGKIRLIELRDGSKHPLKELPLSDSSILNAINNNRILKGNYEILIEEIGLSLQSQLRGSGSNISLE
jgi:hypothetical protein